MDTPLNAVSPERLLQMAWSFAPTLTIRAAVETGLFEALSGRPRTAGEVAAAAGCAERGVRPVLDVLAGFGVLEKHADHRFALTPESAAFLVPGRPGYLGPLFSHFGQSLMPRWLHLTETVRSGQPVFAVDDQASGAGFFTGFVEALFPLAFPAATVLAQALRISEATGETRVLDLAAGSGVWGIVLAGHSPHVQITAVDWPDVLPVTQRVAARHGVGDRMRVVAGDLLEAPFGAGYRVATLGQILHSEGETRSRVLLRKTFDALAPGGTAAIAEFLVNRDRTGPVSGLIFGVNMLVHSREGGTYSFEEIGGWLEEAGFVNVRTLDAPGPSPLILADRPA